MLNRLRFISLTNVERALDKKIYLLDPKGYEQTTSIEEHDDQRR